MKLPEEGNIYKLITHLIGYLSYYNKYFSPIKLFMTYTHSYYYKTIEDVKDYLHPGGVKYFILDAEQRLRVTYGNRNVEYYTDQYMAIFSTMYLAASRVAEVTRIKLNDLRVFKENGVLYFKIRTRNMKHPTKKVKVVVVSYSTPHDKVFIKKITKWYKRLFEKYDLEKKTGYTWKQVLCRDYKHPDDKSIVNTLLEERYLFPSNVKSKHKDHHLGANTIQKKCRKVLFCNSHFLRKLRASVLIDKFGASPKQLQEYLGHSCISSGNPYVAISQTNIKKMVANKQFV